MTIVHHLGGGYGARNGISGAVSGWWWRFNAHGIRLVTSDVAVRPLHDPLPGAGRPENLPLDPGPQGAALWRQGGLKRAHTGGDESTNLNAVSHGVKNVTWQNMTHASLYLSPVGPQDWCTWSLGPLRRSLTTLPCAG